MRRLLVAVMAFGLLAPAAPAAARADVVRLDGVRIELRAGTTQVVTVAHTHAADPRARLPHHRIRKGDHWVQDNASDHYNRLRNQREGGFRWWLPSSHPDSSERLTDYPRQYEWSIVTDFNVEQVRHRGSGIFLHVNGRGATAGCVSAPRRFVRSLVRLLDPARVPVIGIGR